MDHKYRVIFGRTVLMSDMHPIEQESDMIARKFQLREPEHPHCGFHVMGAPRTMKIMTKRLHLSLTNI